MSNLLFRASSSPTLPSSTTVKGAALSNLEVDGNFASLNTYKVEKTTATGSAALPAGTTAERDGSATAGYLRFNTSTTQFEGYDGSNWTSVGGATLADDTTTDTTYYPALATSTSGTALTLKVTSTKLYFNPSTGTLNSTTFNSLSDATLKTDVVRINGAANAVKSIDGVEFTWKDTGKKSAGVIAQQLESILPHLVDTGGDGVKSVNYNGLIGYLIEAIKQQELRITHLERSINN